ncbi:MAG: response regulator transcription factor [Fimbriimonadaceae bacterium]
MNDRILVVDDDRFLLDNVSKLLQGEGYVVEGAGSGEEALDRLERNVANMVVLDLGLPGIDGLTTCRRIRKKWTMPVLMLTARTDATDKVFGLEVGADDYLTKPFDGNELVARVRAHLRRNNQYAMGKTGGADPQVIGDLRVDHETRGVELNGKAVPLTTKEFDLIAYLAKNLGRAISRDQLFESVWGYEMDYNTNSLDVYIYRIRRKIEVDPNRPRYLQTMRGYGYRMMAED